MTRYGQVRAAAALVDPGRARTGSARVDCHWAARWAGGQRAVGDAIAQRRVVAVIVRSRAAGRPWHWSAHVATAPPTLPWLGVVMRDAAVNATTTELSAGQRVWVGSPKSRVWVDLPYTGGGGGAAPRPGRGAKVPFLSRGAACRARDLTTGPDDLGARGPLLRAGCLGGLRDHQNQPAGWSRSPVLSAAWPIASSGTAVPGAMEAR